MTESTEIRLNERIDRIVQSSTMDGFYRSGDNSYDLQVYFYDSEHGSMEKALVAAKYWAKEGQYLKFKQLNTWRALGNDEKAMARKQYNASESDVPIWEWYWESIQ